MNQEQKNAIIQIIQETLGIETPEEITPDAEFIADLNSSTDEIKQIIDNAEDLLEVDIEVNQPLDSLTIGKFFEILEESLI